MTRNTMSPGARRALLLLLLAATAVWLTWAGRWFAALVNGLLAGIVLRDERGAPLVAGLATTLGWGALLLFQATGDRFGAVAHALADVMRLPVAAPIVLTLLLAFLLAWSMASLVVAILPPRACAMPTPRSDAADAPRIGRSVAGVAPLLLAPLLAASLASCVDERRFPGEDTTAIARIVGQEAIPRLPAGARAQLVATSRVGGSFDSAFVRTLAPVAARLRAGDGTPPLVVGVMVEGLELTGDSATVTVRREGQDRRDPERTSSTVARYRLAFHRDSGWRVSTVEVSNMQGEGKLPERPKDLWKKP